MARYGHCFPLGAQLLDKHHTRFSFWAPDLEEVTLEIAGHDPQTMTRLDDGLHRCEAEVGPGECYGYRISPDLVVPDPASRQQRDDVHGPSLVVDPRAYEWRHSDWKGRPWQETVVYEVHVGCYGGFAGIEAELARLRDLGITAIELMPIADFSGTRNWGYDGVLPYAPDRAYGTPEDLKRLIDSAHGLGLCVYLDVVYNHFGPDGNYLHSYASPFFSEETPSPWGPAIDFEQPRVREFFTQNALYWLLEYRFDGLRLDAVHAISDPGWLDEMATEVRGRCEPDRHIHLMLENERNAVAHLERDFDAQWNDDMHNVVHVLLTKEHEGYYANYQQAPAAMLARGLAEGFIYQGEPAPSRGNRPRGAPSAHLSPDHFVFFLQNHDQTGNRAFGERLAALVPPQALRAAVTLQLLCPQIPLLFMGEERGLTTPFLFFTDFHGDLAEAVRKGRRAEFSAFSHFADPEVQAKIPDPNLEETFLRSADRLYASGGAASSPTPEEHAWEDFYRELLTLRRTRVAPHLARTRSLGARAVGDGAVRAAWQLNDDTILQLLVNLGDQELSTDPVPGTLLFESHTGAGEQARRGVAAAQATSFLIEDGLRAENLGDRV